MSYNDRSVPFFNYLIHKSNTSAHIQHFLHAYTHFYTCDRTGLSADCQTPWRHVSIHNIKAWYALLSMQFTIGTIAQRTSAPFCKQNSLCQHIHTHMPGCIFSYACPNPKHYLYTYLYIRTYAYINSTHYNEHELVAQEVARVTESDIVAQNCLDEKVDIVSECVCVCVCVRARVCVYVCE